MSYGVNAPFGLQPINYLNAANWTSQIRPYKLKSGYAQNISQGDPVIIGGTADKAGAYEGYIMSLYDAAAASSSSIVGVFHSVAYALPDATAPFSLGGLGLSSWKAGTITQGSLDAIAYVYDDPNTIYKVQTANEDGAPATQANVGSVFQLTFNGVSPEGIVPIFGVGESSVSATGASRDAASVTGNFLCLDLEETPNGMEITPETATYNNIIGVIQNHAYAARPAPRP